MNRGKIIVVEGPSNSGKTTTCQNMKNYSNCVVIDECMVYEKNPPRPSKNYEQELQNQEFFFEVEKRNGKSIFLIYKFFCITVWSDICDCNILSPHNTKTSPACCHRV